MNAGKKPELRRSIFALVAANLVTIALALIEGWNLHELMVVYWAQSVIIGAFSALRILALRQFSTEGLSQNGKPVTATHGTKLNMALFFILHYGAFHFVYLVFILKDESRAFAGNEFYLLICVLVFLINHYFSFVENRAEDEIKKPNIGTIMYFPYLRVIPMHLTIIAGGALGTASQFTLVLFLILKTIADVLMHRIEHRGWPRHRPGS